MFHIFGKPSAENGFDPHYGASPLKRLIQQDIQNKMATMILAGEIKEDDTAIISVSGDHIAIKVK